MKIEKLTDDKLKITLSIDDLEERNINLHSFMYNSPESQDLFWELLQTAEKDYDFHVDDSFIYVEASTTGSGIFTLLVTKTDDKAPEIPRVTRPKKITKDSFRLKRKAPEVKTSNNYYVFQTFEDIIDFCSICDTSILNDNTLYQLNDAYYLKIDFVPYHMILDYATVVKYTPVLEARISEYGKVIIEHDALQTIRLHFHKMTKKKTSK